MLPRMKVSIVKKNASKRQKLVTGFVFTAAMAFLWIGGTSGSIQPNLTSVETWSETQIKVTWQPFEHADSVEPHFYELYIDDYLEYFGNDLIYVARRLTPDTLYHFKLRSCTQETYVCSLFSESLSGTTDHSHKRGFTKSFFQWAFLCLIVTIFACTTALLGAKISRRLWRSFLYRYDFRSEMNLQVPKYIASTDTIDEDLVSSSICLKKSKQTDEKTFKRDSKAPFFEASEETSKQEQHVKETEPLDKEKISKCSEDVENISKDASKDFLDLEVLKSKKIDSKGLSTPANVERLLKETVFERKEFSKPPCGGKGENEKVTIQRAHTHPKIVRDFNSKKKSKCHKRTFSYDSNLRTKNQQELLELSENGKNVNQPSFRVKRCCDTVIVVDNSNIFIGAQECATLRKPNERKRNIRVKIQQLVKVFQRGRPVSCAVVQGSSPPTTEQVWEVYRRLGYSVDLEDRRGKDEQRVDEGLHLHIYKALFELSPQTLVIASGDGNKGKSECATSLPGCAEAAIEKGWLVEVHSWQHSTSMEWIKLSKKYPDRLTIHFLDRYINHITFVDGKHGRKCQPFPADFFKSSNELLN